MNRDTAAERKQYRTIIEDKLLKTGEKDRLKEHLRQRLIECGWKEDLKALCKEVITKRGIEAISVDDLVHEISPKAKSSVPDSIRNELLGKIKQFLKDQEA